MQFIFDNGLLLAGLAAGCLGTLTLEHGWGWVLAQYKARKARLAEQAQDALSTAQTKVDSAIAAFRSDIDTLKGDVAILKAKAGL